MNGNARTRTSNDHKIRAIGRPRGSSFFSPSAFLFPSFSQGYARGTRGSVSVAMLSETTLSYLLVLSVYMPRRALAGPTTCLTAAIVGPVGSSGNPRSRWGFRMTDCPERMKQQMALNVPAKKIRVASDR